MVGPGRRSDRTAPRLARVALFLSVTLLALSGWALALPTPRASPSGVLEIQQSANPLPGGTFTVAMQVANPSMVKFVYYTFCQLSQPVCYSPPITMTANATSWFVGTTKPMSSYPGMVAGTAAGYNITIEYSNNTNVTEPHLPNAFPNLTVKTEVGGEYMFEMVVRSQVYDLRGTVSDASTGSPISGATLSLSPGTNTTTTDASGAYTFTGLSNGSYSLTISEPGYEVRDTTLRIQGAPLEWNVTISKPAAGPSGGGAPFSGLLSYALVAGVIAIVAGLAVWGMQRRRRKTKTPPTDHVEDSPPPGSGSG